MNTPTRDDLADALDDFDLWGSDRVSPYTVEETGAVLAHFAQIVYDFPTDEMVEAAAKGWKDARQSPIVNEAAARAALEAVRRVMYGETDD